VPGSPAKGWLDVLTSGPLLRIQARGHEQGREILARLREAYDLVIVDTSPLLLVSER